MQLFVVLVNNAFSLCNLYICGNFINKSLVCKAIMVISPSSKVQAKLNTHLDLGYMATSYPDIYLYYPALILQCTPSISHVFFMYFHIKSCSKQTTPVVKFVFSFILYPFYKTIICYKHRINGYIHNIY